MIYKKTTAIHQPNFLPWIGFFNKIISADTFILLDNVQYPKSGGAGNWTNRHLILHNGKERWATVPISRNFSGTKTINEIKIAQNTYWKEDYLKKINYSYSNSKFFPDTYQFLKDSFSYETQFLCEFNIHLIRAVLKVLELPDNKLVKSSDFQITGKSNNLLCSLTKAVGADTYICGSGAESYMDKTVFELNNISIVYQNYIASHYQQIGTTKFISGLSIIDAMMNCGFKETKKLVFGVDYV